MTNMTRDDIVRMAHECGILMRSHKHQEEPTKLERFAALVAAHEREACCSIVHGQCESDNVAQRTVDAIRARSLRE